MSSLAALD